VDKDNYNIKVKFWGTRGSIPTPGKHFVKYGSNTPCVEIRCGGTIIILDAGSGMRELGGSLLNQLETKMIKSHYIY
jgi:phosphoribosyl 1,2-cyclic phosphodiesterase